VRCGMSNDETKRYSFDVGRALGEENQETNQVNIRLAYEYTHDDDHRTELGISGQWGQLYNHDTEDSGDHWAAAAHLNGFYGPWNIMLEAIRFRLSPENPSGQADDTVVMGAFPTAFP